MNKICIYAIAKNESENVLKWLDSMQEADYIVVLDTGSTDDTVELLKNDPRVTRVEQQIIDPWRFDVARNESMKLCPDDANILVSTDFDELFTPGWADKMRDAWIEGDTTRLHYTYAWSHNDLGEPQDVFIYDKAHTRDYHWIFPVHEVLYPIVPENFIEHCVDLGTTVYLHHWQDMTKPRKYYFELLELGVEENPGNSHVKMLLAREYFLQKRYDEALTQYLECLELPDIRESYRKLVLLETIGKIGDLYAIKEDFDKAIEYYNMFIKEDKTYREPYFCLAEIYNKKEMYAMAKAIAELGLKESYQKYDWVERRDNWLYKVHDILAVADYYLGNLDEALYHGQISARHNPNDLRILRNYIAFLEDKLKQYQAILTPPEQTTEKKEESE